MAEKFSVVNEYFLPFFESEHKFQILWGGAGCLAPDTEVVMADGSLKKVQDVKLGDYLLGYDSKPNKVVNLYQGEEPMYRVKQTKGQDYVVNESHVLSLKVGGGEKLIKHYNMYVERGGVKMFTPMAEKGDIISMSVREFNALSGRRKKNLYGYKKDVDFEYKQVPIDPYILGLWLGDGSSTSPLITTADQEVVDAIYQYAEKIDHKVTVNVKKNRENKANNYSITKGNIGGHEGVLKTELIDLGVLGNKHIPDIYKYNSRDVRLQLLAGILDADGSVNTNCYVIIQKNELLSDDIVYLSHSLGFKCSKKQVTRVIKSINFSGQYFSMNINGDVQEIPVKIERKKIKNVNKTRETSTSSLKIEPLGVGKYFGFELESDRRFFLKDFTVTCNSGKSFSIMQKIVKICLEESGTRVLACRKFRSSIKESVFKQFKSFIEEYGLNQFVKINSTDMSFHFYNGSEIVTTGLDDVAKLKSINELSIIFIEEATEIEKSDFDQLVLRLRGTGKKRKNIIMSFNPVSQLHWLKEVFFNDDEKPNPNVFKLHSTFLNNDFIDDGYKETLFDMYSKEGNENLYRIYVQGEWGRIKTNNEFYANFNFNKHTKDSIALYPHERLHISFDFNVSPYMSLIIAQIIWDNKRELWQVNILDEILGISPRNTTEAVCDMFLEQWADKIKDEIYIYGDASGRSRNPANKLHQYDIITTILAPYISPHSLRVPKANPSILKRRGFISRILNGGYNIDIRISKNCKKLIEDLENVTEDADGKKSIKKVRNKETGAVYVKYGHLSDTLDYLLVEAFKGYFDNYQYNPDR